MLNLISEALKEKTQLSEKEAKEARELRRAVEGQDNEPVLGHRLSETFPIFSALFSRLLIHFQGWRSS